MPARLSRISQSSTKSKQLTNSFRNDASVRRMRNCDSLSLIERNENASPRTIRHSIGEQVVRFVNKKSQRTKSKRTRNPHSSGNAKQQNNSSAKNRALAVLRRMRAGDSLTAACREENIDPRTVRKYLDNEIKQTETGKYQAKKTDRLTRKMIAPTAYGMEPITVRGSKQATLLGKYLSAVRKFLRTGDGKDLAKFKGKKIGNQKLITDLATLKRLAQADALQLEDIYAATGVA